MKTDFSYNYDDNGNPTGIKSAFGYKFVVPIDLSDIGQINADVVKSLEKVQDLISNVKKEIDYTLSVLDDDEKAYAKRMLKYQYIQMSENSELSIRNLFLDPNSVEDSLFTYSGGLSEREAMRLHVVSAAENYIVSAAERTGARGTMHKENHLDRIWDAIVSAMPMMDDCEDWREALPKILIEDGWCVWKLFDGLHAAPYGDGVPGYDPETYPDDHPAWSKNPLTVWQS